MFSIPIMYNKSALETRIQESSGGYVKCDLVVTDIDLEPAGCEDKVVASLYVVQLLYNYLYTFVQLGLRKMVTSLLWILRQIVMFSNKLNLQ